MAPRFTTGRSAYREIHIKDTQLVNTNRIVVAETINIINAIVKGIVVHANSREMEARLMAWIFHVENIRLRRLI